MDLVARRDGYVEGVGTWIGEDRNHSFVRLLAAHKANGNDVALITPTIDFPKTWKKWVLYLSPSGGGGGGHFMKLVITDNLSFTDYYHGNSQWQCFIANQNQECHCTCQWWQVSWNAPQESITQWCMTMVMQTWYQLKTEELLLASTYDLRYEYVYLRNSWPLNFDNLFLGTPCVVHVLIYW